MRDYNKFREELLKQRDYIANNHGTVTAVISYITDSGMDAKYYSTECDGIFSNKKPILYISDKTVELGANYREMDNSAREVSGLALRDKPSRPSPFDDEITDLLCHSKSDETAKYLKYYPFDTEDNEPVSEYYIIDGVQPYVKLKTMDYQNAADILQNARRATDEEVECIKAIKAAHPSNSKPSLVEYRVLMVKNIVSVELDRAVYESEYIHNEKEKLLEKYY